MVPALAAAFLSAVLGAEPRVPDAIVMHAVPPVNDVLLQALPPPPQKVVLETRYYGTITVDHVAHLSRRTSCKGCHGAGPVSKIEFTPKLAHERCKGCHNELQRGPTQCRGCHVISPAMAERLHIAQSAPAAAPAAAGETGPAPAPGAVAPAATGTTALATRAPPAAATAERAPPRGFRRSLEMGASAGPAGAGTGPVVRMSFRDDAVLFTESVERLAGDRVSRTFALMGAGMAFPIRERWDVTAVAIAGLDAVDRPTTAFLPAIGGRVGVEYFFRSGLVETIHLSMTGSLDLSSRDFNGSRVGGSTLFFTLATGLRMGGAR